MKYKKLENALLYVLLVVTGVVYLYTVAPTLSFWDCGEFISSAYALAVPHPPGTPFYIFFGRLWLMLLGLIAAILPISKEVAWHMNLLGLGFSVLTLFFLYRMLLKIFRMILKNGDELSSIIIAFASCLSIAFFYTYWGNAIETEVYAASTFVFVLINYLGLLWYESVKQGAPKNHFLLLSFYLIFLSTGIHLIPFLIFIPLYVFAFVVERHYIRDTLFQLLCIFQLIFFALLFLLPRPLQFPVLCILGLILLAAIVLPLNNSVKYRNWRFFWAGIFLVIMGISTELYLPVRSQVLTRLYKDKAVAQQYLAGANIAPRINECNPGENFTAFNDVLHRVQYGPTRLIPRQTQDATGFNVITGYFWQLALCIRYISWQPMPEGMNRYVRAVVLALFYLFSIWGMVELYKRERKLFAFTILIMFMLFFAMTGYLNLKFSPSDSNPNHQPREVRERDYFFHTTAVYFGVFMGLGFLGFTQWLKDESKNKQIVHFGSLGGIVVFSVVPFFTNITVNNRFGNFLPKDYGYNMLDSCDRGAILFTNGDNDTFPLWFAQEVLRVRRDVIVANLSLINTNWYIKQLKDWGVPISFSDYVIDRLEPFMTRDRRVFYVKDIMIRNIIAANGGITLTNEDYVMPAAEFAERHLKGYKGKYPIFFASTVSQDNFEGYAPYLKLEGIVYRVTGDSGIPLYNVDLDKTRNFFYNVYRYTGVFSPEKQPVLKTILMNFEKRKQEGEFFNFAIQKDENTRRLYSNYAAGLHNLGIILKDRGDIRGTINAWRFALLFEPEPSYFFDYNLGVLFAELGMLDSAKYYFSQVEVKDPQVMLGIASLYRTVGELDYAITYFRKAMNLNPQLPQAYFGLYSTYLGKYDTVSAVSVLRDWLRINPADTSAIAMLKRLSKE